MRELALFILATMGVVIIRVILYNFSQSVRGVRPDGSEAFLVLIISIVLFIVRFVFEGTIMVKYFNFALRLMGITYTLNYIQVIVFGLLVDVLHFNIKSRLSTIQKEVEKQ